MTELILPGSVERNQLIEQATDSQLAFVDWFNEQLALIDRNLKLIFCGDRFPDLPGVVPGRWHVVRLADRRGELPSFKAIVAADGGYMEPHSGIFDQLKRMDLWGPDGIGRLERERAEEAEARARRVQAMREEAKEEFALRLKAVTNPGIRFGGSWRARLGDLKRGGSDGNDR
jgi:hypothetical protein